jgi:hypothetical protein
MAEALSGLGESCVRAFCAMRPLINKVSNTKSI